MDRAVEKRIARERAKHERETEELRQIALQNRQQEAKPQVQTQEAPPSLEDFQDYETYLKAYITNI